VNYPERTVGIAAGEASGDLLGAHLVHALRNHVPRVRFVGIAGPRMRDAGVEALFCSEKLAVRGYVEVLRHYFSIVGIRRRLTEHFLRERPDLFIGIDAPDFNLDLEVRLKSAGIRTAHYVSPSIWAWRPDRISKIRRAADMVLALFPFEPDLYEKAGIPVSYVGHPLADMLGDFPGRESVRENLQLPAGLPVIALLPGSRVSEVAQLSTLFIAAAQRIAHSMPEAMFLVPLIDAETEMLFREALRAADAERLKLTLLRGRAHEAMAASDVVLVASGTATLEAALLRRPMVIAYRMPRLSWWIMRNRNRLPYVGLPNILAGEFLVPEFLQDEATPENLAGAVMKWLGDRSACAQLEKRFGDMLVTLRQNAAEKAAAALLPMLKAGA
jgi:lipid-A-disaccharide synthase